MNPPAGASTTKSTGSLALALTPASSDSATVVATTS